MPVVTKSITLCLLAWFLMRSGNAQNAPTAMNIQGESFLPSPSVAEGGLSFAFPGFAAGHYGKGTTLLIHNVSFEDASVPVSELAVKRLSEGVYELTDDASRVGMWKFEVRDAANGYYALGERFNSLNHSHEIIKNSSQDNVTDKGTGTYKPIPFFMSTSGYGLWVDTTAEATFDMNVTSRENLMISLPGQKLRIVLIAGPKFSAILDRFTALAGRSILPPYWTFAPWVGRDYHRDDSEVAEDIKKTRDLGLPADVILVDSPWATGYNSYIFNQKQFHNPSEMVNGLHRAAFKLVLWHTSWINSKTMTPAENGFANKIDIESSNYQDAYKHGYFVTDDKGKPYTASWWKGEGSLIDFTNFEAKKWWKGQVSKAVDAGADGFKDDDAEGNFQQDTRFFDGTDPRLMRNRYAVLYNKAVEEVLQEKLNGNGVLFMRSATVGNHNLAFLWGGDNEADFSKGNGLPTAVTAGLGAGLSGMPLWTADLGGYLKTASTPDPRLFMRWTQYAAFSPVMETLSTSNRNAWDYGPDALRNYRKYAVLHMSLFPYIYAAAQEASRTGMPIMRALVLAYQNDVRARDSENEYLFGPDLLIAPVIDENTSRPVYLPAGTWIDYWTGKVLHGTKVILASAPPDVLPLYARANSVIAKIPEDIMTLVPERESGNSSISSMDDRRVFELMPYVKDSAPTDILDFENRHVTRTSNSIRIDGKFANVILRWRFGHVQMVSVNGDPQLVHRGVDGPYIKFKHEGSSIIEWK